MLTMDFISGWHSFTFLHVGCHSGNCKRCIYVYPIMIPTVHDPVKAEPSFKAEPILNSLKVGNKNHNLQSVFLVRQQI